MIRRRAALAAPLLALPHAAARAQGTATQVVIPYAPGGASDVVGRLLTEGLAQRLGGTFVMDHKPGASTTIAARHVARARPDGQTLLLGTIVTFSMAPLALRQPGYDPVADFTHLTQLCDTEALLVANPRWESLAQLFEAARQRPGQLSYASWGIGTTAHLPMVELTARAGVEMLHVPFNGSPPAMTEVIAGRVDCMIALVAACRGHVEAGRMRALGAVTVNRVAAFPAIPTVAEQGFPGFGGGAWYSLQAPPGLPEPLKARLTQAAVESFSTPEAIAFMRGQGLAPAAAFGEAPLVARIRRELDQHRELMARAGIQQG
ncbi:Bug family tripartite tricarboxylate transporter substrate binding protein [Rubritepida flocculans]|uniref:Bug family tripartite tricarboxylate transporter substrate binding protein n=1 Tax=Rubritepida flocculans TaxID=182403 RepID=UPI00040642F7|nr:tripartite tricarboxylate transporter substrate binding protein [Rubritepida flocculans]